MDLGQDEAGRQVYAIHCEVTSSPFLLPQRPRCADLATTMTLAVYSLLITHSHLKYLLPVISRTLFSPDFPPPMLAILFPNLCW